HRRARHGRPDRDRVQNQGSGKSQSRAAQQTMTEEKMDDFLNQLAFGWFPYVAITVLFVGSILRFDADQFSWRSQSSQFLRRRQMMIGSNLFHMGVLVLFFGHLIGLLTPIGVFETLRISHGAKQVLALVVGGIAGIAALI